MKKKKDFSGSVFCAESYFKDQTVGLRLCGKIIQEDGELDGEVSPSLMIIIVFDENNLSISRKDDRNS